MKSKNLLLNHSRSGRMYPKHFSQQIFLFMLLIFSCLSQCAQQPQMKIPPIFVETDPPEVSSNGWYALNRSEDAFGVEIAEGELRIKRAQEINHSSLQLSKGKLQSFNYGEFGGKLTFQPKDSSMSQILIKEGNVKFIFRFQGNVYFLEGLAHMTTSEGALFVLDTTVSPFGYKEILHFDDSPEAYAIFQDQILIASHQNFYAIQHFKVEVLFPKAFWRSLYPNSIAVADENNVFVGIRGGIVKLDLERRKLTFYRYDASQSKDGEG